MPFSIHQFSRGINIKNEGGKWVAGGFGPEIANASYPVPEEIKQAVNTTTKGGWRMFGIQEAYPPQPDTIALIARELGDYCVLAVANRLKDDTGTREFVGYRYFWLDKKQFQNPQNVDGIGTLLWYWQDKEKQPQYNIRELQNNRSSYTTSWENCHVPYLFGQWEKQYSQQIQSLLEDIRPSQQPLIYEATQIGGELTWQEVHCLAIKYGEVNKRYINWAWNVRKLENTQDLNVIYCADAEAFQLFNRQFPPVTAPTPAATPTPTSSLHDGLTGQNIPPNKKSNTLVTQCLQQFGLQFTKNDVLTLLNFYQQYQEQIWDYRTPTYLTTFSTNPQPQHIKYATLLTALAPNKTQDIFNQLIRLNQRDKLVAIQFLVDLKQTAIDDKLCCQHSYFIYFYGALSLLQDELSESSEPNSSSFPPNLNRLRDQIRRFLSPILIILLLGGTVGLMYWQRSNILSILPRLPYQNSSENLETNDSPPENNVDNSQTNIVDLLNVYEKIFDGLNIGKKNPNQLEQSQTFQSLSTALQASRAEIRKILNDNQQLLTDLKDKTQVVQEARQREIYKQLKLFTPLNSTETEKALPSLQEDSNDYLSVTMLQEALKRGGYYLTGQEDTDLEGIFGEATKNAVIQAQTKAGFEQNDIVGRVGPKTWGVLKDRVQDLQVEAVYQMLQTHLTQDNPTSNIVTEIKNCRDKHNKEKTPLHFNDCLENIGTPTTQVNEGGVGRKILKTQE